MTKEELITEAREYLAQHSEYCEVFGETFVAVDTLTAMVDFAEPRENRIAELEARCNELFLQTCEQAEEIKELEKENAELKAEKGCETCTKFDEVKLTKAKELLNEFLDFESSCMERGIYISDKTRAEAEQFLNSEVEK